MRLGIEVGRQLVGLVTLVTFERPKVQEACLLDRLVVVGVLGTDGVDVEGGTIEDVEVLQTQHVRAVFQAVDDSVALTRVRDGVELPGRDHDRIADSPSFGSAGSLLCRGWRRVPEVLVDFSVIEQRLYPKYCERQQKSQRYEKSGDRPKRRIAPQAPDHPGSFASLPLRCRY